MDIHPVFIVLVLLVVHWYTSLFGQTFFHHRFKTHNMFKMTKGWEKFFHVLTFIVQGSSYLSVRTYVIMHRLHHAHSDEEQDPHSPRYFRNIFELLWNMKKRFAFLLRYNPDLSEKEIQERAKKYLNEKSLKWFQSLKKVSNNYLRKLPEETALQRFADHWVCRLTWGAIYGIPYYFIAQYLIEAHLLVEFGWLLLFWPLHFIMGPIQGTIVNWFGHAVGYQNFKNGDDSRNTLLVDIFLLGELYQNNHHYADARANFAVKWWEFDPVYPILLLFKKLKIIKFTLQ